MQENRHFSGEKACKITKIFPHMQENRHFSGKLSQKMCGIAYFFEEKVTSHLQKCVLVNLA